MPCATPSATCSTARMRGPLHALALHCACAPPGERGLRDAGSGAAAWGIMARTAAAGTGAVGAVRAAVGARWLHAHRLPRTDLRAPSSTQPLPAGAGSSARALAPPMPPNPNPPCCNASSTVPRSHQPMATRSSQLLLPACLQGQICTHGKHGRCMRAMAGTNRRRGCFGMQLWRPRAAPFHPPGSCKWAAGAGGWAAPWGHQAFRMQHQGSRSLKVPPALDSCQRCQGRRCPGPSLAAEGP